MFKQNNQPCTRILLSYYSNGKVTSDEVSEEHMILDNQSLSGGLAHWISDYNHIFKAEELIDIIDACTDKLILMGVNVEDNLIDRRRLVNKKLAIVMNDELAARINKKLPSRR